MSKRAGLRKGKKSDSQAKKRAAGGRVAAGRTAKSVKPAAGGAAVAPVFPWAWRYDGIAVLGLVLLLWFGRYWQMAGFGLYEDDHWRITANLHLPVEQSLGDSLVTNLAMTFGRFGHEALIRFLALAGRLAGGLAGMHAVGFLVLALNTVLFYVFLRRLPLPATVSAAGVVAFCLFPVDVSQVFLTHALGTHPSLTVFLLAGLAYQAGGWWRAISYPLAAMSLFIYESFYLLFFGLPWLDRRQRGKGLCWGWLFHAAVAGTLFVAVAALRVRYGDGRTRGAWALDDLLPRIATRLWEGPWVCLKMFLVRATEAGADIAGSRWAVFAVALVLCASLLVWLAGLAEDSWERKGFPYGRLALAGVGFLVLAYPLSFELPVDLPVGRHSRAHMAAVIGLTLLFTAVCGVAMKRTAVTRLHWLPGVSAGVFGALLVLAAFRVQDDYVDKWDEQKALLTDIASQTPDLTDRSIVLVEIDKLRRDSGFDPWSWETYHLLPALYHYPAEWKRVPHLFWLDPDWRERVAATGDLFDGVQLVVIARRHLNAHRGGDVIYFDAVDGRLVRVAGPLVVGENSFPTKSLPSEPGFAPFPRREFFDWAIRDVGAPPLEYANTAD